jgi:hypothetical protein
MHTCYSICTNEVLNLRLSNHKHLTRLLHSLALKWLLRLNKWAREVLWTSRSCIYRASLQIQPLPSNSAPVWVIGRSDDRRQMRPTRSNSVLKRLTIRGTSDSGQHPMLTHRTRPTPLGAFSEPFYIASGDRASIRR